MIKHIVFMKFKSEVTKVQIAHIFSLLEGLRQPIPQITSFKYGKNESPENLSHSFDYGFEVEFDNTKDRDIYLHHPNHIEVAKQIIPLLDNGIQSLLAFDYDPDKGL